MKLDIQKYLETSSIHALAYTTKQFHIVERIFWSITLTSSIICTLTLIIELGIKMKIFPIVSYLSDKSVSVSEIYFPAVTVCPVFLPYLPLRNPSYMFPSKFFRYEKHTSDKYYYEDVEFTEETVDERRLNLTYVEILKKIDAGEIQIEELGSKILKRLQVVDTMLNLEVFAKTNLTYPKDDFLDVINEFDKEFLDNYGDVCFNFRQIFYRYVSEVITSYGLCFSYNIALSRDLLNLNLTSDYFNFKIFPTCKTFFEKPVHEVQEMPKNETSYPDGLRVMFSIGLFNKAIDRNVAGYHFFLHDPFELPSSSSKMFVINVNGETYIKITPQINQIDDSIADYDPVDRNCYLETERKLKFFKKYTKANCIQECLTEFMINRCSCVEFFMIRNSTTQICSANEKNCTTNAKNDFEGQLQSCGCLQPCNYVKYEYELAESGIMPRNLESKSIIVKIGYDNLRYNPSVRKQQFDKLDFFSYFGGLLGLFAGISVLSIVETIYWFAARLFSCRTGRATSKVIPLVRESEVRRSRLEVLKDYVKKFMNESSIHGLQFIINGSAIQNTIWTIFVTISIIGCFFMISETEKKVPNSRVVALDDILKYKGHIDFPAFSIFPPKIENQNAYKEKLEIYHKLQELDEKGINLTEEMLKEYVLLDGGNCHSDQNRLAFPNSKSRYGVIQFNEYILKNISRLDWFQQQSFYINGKYQPVFAEVSTYRGMAYSFNLVDVDELLNHAANIKESRYFKNVTMNNARNESKSIKNMKIGMISNAVFRMKIKRQANVDECNVNGFLVHKNDETPRLMDPGKISLINYGLDLDIEVIPEIIKTDQDLKRLTPEERECYFDGEKSLKFYKKYSMEKCVLECHSNYSIEQCGCVYQMHQVASDNEYCEFMYWKEMNALCDLRSKNDFYLNDIFSSPPCSCLPTCDSVTYNIKYFHKTSTTSDEILINLRVNTEDAILFRRYQQFTFSDVVSYVGGLLGLFAGISMLSIVEIFYFFVIRVAVDVWRRLRGQ